MSSPIPDFAGNQRVYLSFVEAGPDGTSGAALGYGRLILGQGAAAPRRLQGHLAAVAEGDRRRPFLAPHRLRARRHHVPVVGRAAEVRRRRRTSSSDLGKIIHLTDGGRQRRQPWAPRRHAAIYTMGHRNVLGLAFAPDGRLWATRDGAAGRRRGQPDPAGQELRLAAGLERHHYGGGDIPDDHKRPTASRSRRSGGTRRSRRAALMIYTGDLFPQWKGDALDRRAVGRGVDPRRHRRRQGAQGRPVGDGRAHPRGRPGPATARSICWRMDRADAC